MLDDLIYAAPGRRHFVMDGPKVATVLSEPSTFPKWMRDFFTVPRMRHVQRMIRIIKMVLDKREHRLGRRDRELLAYMREWANGNAPRYYGELF
jgi:hypothetical protein